MSPLDLATTINYYTVSTGIFIGGIWGVWKWSTSEYLRKNSEIPAIDGKMEVEINQYSKDKSILTINMIWRNLNRFPLFIGTKETRIT